MGDLKQFIHEPIRRRLFLASVCFADFLLFTFLLGTMNAPSSLYIRCVQLLDKLSAIAGTERYLSTTARIDPVSLLWSAFRRGGILCHLVNLLRPNTITAINDIDASTEGSNLAKSNVYYFLLACRDALHMSEDDLFAVSKLYRDDTDHLLCVIHTVELVVNQLQMEGNFQLSQLQQAAAHTPIDIDSMSNRQKVVFELVSTERKYVADLEHLQVLILIVSEPDSDARCRTT
jgi:cell division control protein 24